MKSHTCWRSLSRCLHISVRPSDLFVVSGQQELRRCCRFVSPLAIHGLRICLCAPLFSCLCAFCHCIFFPPFIFAELFVKSDSPQPPKLLRLSLNSNPPQVQGRLGWSTTGLFCVCLVVFFSFLAAMLTRPESTCLGFFFLIIVCCFFYLMYLCEF